MELLDATTEEISVCLLIANTLKMFLPARTKYHILAYQLHFCLFANDVLEYAGYSKFSRELCPKTSISNINTLHLDAPSIYQILTQKLDDDFDENQDALSTELIIYGYNKEPIPSIERARRNKDAIFNSIFDYTKIQESCEHSGLIFNQRVSIIPGLKTVRILGLKKNTTSSVEPKKPSYTERVLQNANVIHEGQKSLEILKSEVANIHQEVKMLKVELEEILNLQKESDPIKNLKMLRKDWNKSTNKTVLYQNIQKEKKKRDSNYKRINEINDQLRQKKHTMYFKQVAIRYKPKIPITDTIKSSSSDGESLKKELKKENKGISRSEMCRLLNPEQFTFSGTDNGLVNMTTAVPFSMKRFEFHLKLFNYYSSLDESNNETIPIPPVEIKPFLNLPKATVIKSSEIDLGCGYFKNRIKLEKRKKFTNHGKRILTVENVISKSNLTTSLASTTQFRNNFETQFRHRNEVRDFYNSKKLVNSKRHMEIQKHKFLHKLCNKERKSLVHTTGGNDF